MKKQQLLKHLFLLMIIVLASSAFAQENFSYKANVGKVDSSGFYKILLTPEVIAKSQESLGDVRLKDVEGKTYPYIVQPEIYQRDTTKKSRYATLPGPLIHQNDSTDKKSYINLKWREVYNISKIELAVSGPRFYRRNLNIIGDQGLQYSLIISSSNVNSFPVNFKTRNLKIIIENGDNEPLQVKAVFAFQRKRYLFSWLEKGLSYEIFYGDSAAKTPVYDLAFFKDSINNNAPEITILNINKIRTSSVVSPNQSLSSSKIVIWIVIAAVLAILIFSSVSLLKKIGKQKH